MAFNIQQTLAGLAPQVGNPATNPSALHNELLAQLQRAGQADPFGGTNPFLAGNEALLQPYMAQAPAAPAGQPSQPSPAIDRNQMFALQQQMGNQGDRVKFDSGPSLRPDPLAPRSAGGGSPFGSGTYNSVEEALAGGFQFGDPAQAGPMQLLNAPPPGNAPTSAPGGATVSAPSGNFGYQLDPILDKAAGGDPRTAAGFKSGRDLAAEFYDFGTLGRVGDQLDPGLAEIMNRTNANAFGRTPVAQNALDRVGAEYELGGARDYWTQRQLVNADSIAGISPEEKTLVDESFARRGGLNTAEGQAARAQGVNQVNRAFQGALTQLGQQQGASGSVGGGAMTKAALPISQQFADARSNLERSLILDNVNIQDQRYRDALNTGQQVTNSSFGRFSNLLGQTGNLYNQERTRALDAANSYLGGNLNTENFELNKLTNAQNFQFQARNDLLNRQQYNLDRLSQEKAAQIALITGMGGFGAAQDTFNDILKLGREQIEAAKSAEVPVSFGSLDFGSAGAIGANARQGQMPGGNNLQYGLASNWTGYGLNKNAANGGGFVYGNQGLYGVPYATNNVIS